MHFFTQSAFSFRNTCSYHHSLFCCCTNVMLSIPNLSQLLACKSEVANLSFTLTPHIYLTEHTHTHTHTHTLARARAHPFNGPLSRTTWVSRYQKGKTNLDLTEARDSEWQWHQLGHMQVCTSLQTDNHANTPPLSFLQAGCPSCRPANSVKALKGAI